MKKLIATALAAGALTAGGAASAQDIGSVISSIFGYGNPTYSQSTPAIVAPSNQQMYRDTYGRTFYYDQYGRQVYLQNAPAQIVGYDAWGRPVYNQQQPQVYGQQIYQYPQQQIYGQQQPPHYAWGTPRGNWWDTDGDGVANTRDRWPNDSRYN